MVLNVSFVIGGTVIMSRKVNTKCTACSHCSPPSYDKEYRRPIFRCLLGHKIKDSLNRDTPITLSTQVKCSDFSRA